MTNSDQHLQEQAESLHPLDRPLGIEAAFCNVVKVDGRNVLKLIFEVDLSMRNPVLERLGGYPDGTQWCMIVPFQRRDAGEE